MKSLETGRTGFDPEIISLSPAKTTSREGKKDILEVFPPAKQAILPVEHIGLLGHQFEQTLTHNPWLKEELTDLRQKDVETYEHGIRTAELALFLSKAEGGLPAPSTELLIAASLIHDIGKVENERIMKLVNKPGTLDQEERAIIEEHAMLGYERLKEKNLSIATLMGTHHQRTHGYPSEDRLTLPDTLKPLQIFLSVADEVDAQLGPRPYRTEPLSPDKVKANILERLPDQAARIGFAVDHYHSADHPKAA